MLVDITTTPVAIVKYFILREYSYSCFAKHALMKHTASDCTFRLLTVESTVNCYAAQVAAVEQYHLTGTSDTPGETHRAAVAGTADAPDG